MEQPAMVIMVALTHIHLLTHADPAAEPVELGQMVVPVAQAGPLVLLVHQLPMQVAAE
jgi:hypothetical protein